MHVRTLCEDSGTERGEQSHKWGQSPVCLSRFQFESAWWPSLAEASALGLSVRKNMTLGARFHRLCRFCGEQPRDDSLEHTRYWWGDSLPRCFMLPRNLPSLFLKIFFQKKKTDNQKLFLKSCLTRAKTCLRSMSLTTLQTRWQGDGETRACAAHGSSSQDRRDAGGVNFGGQNHLNAAVRAASPARMWMQRPWGRWRERAGDREQGPRCEVPFRVQPVSRI